MSSTEASYWTSLASAYRALGPPLCPSPLDLEFFQNAVGEQARQRQNLGQDLQCLLMGATAALASMQLPPSTKLLAFDHSLAMSKSVWPGDVPGVRAITCADWRELPLPDATIDIVLADGSLNCVRYPADLRDVAKSVRRVMKPGGVMLARCYLQPELPDSAEAVLKAMFTDPLPSFHYCKLQLLMAMQRDPSKGTRVGDAYDLWTSHGVNLDHLLQVTGWERGAVEMIELYRESNTIHTFPTRAQMLESLHPHFHLAGYYTPPLPLGDRTPTLVLSPRP